MVSWVESRPEPRAVMPVADEAMNPAPVHLVAVVADEEADKEPRRGSCSEHDYARWLEDNSMKRGIAILVMALAVVMATQTMSTAWGLPKKSFSRNIEKALKKERWNKPDEAREYWQTALQKGEELMTALPGRAEYFMGSARCCYALGDYDRSIELYKQALKIKSKQGERNLHKSYPWVYVYLGLAYAQKGDTPMAVRYWEKVPMTVGSVYTTIQKQVKAFRNTQQ